MLCLKSATINWEMCFWNFRTIERVAPSQLMDFINKKHLLSVASGCHWFLWILMILFFGHLAREMNSGSTCWSLMFISWPELRNLHISLLTLHLWISSHCCTWSKWRGYPVHNPKERSAKPHRMGFRPGRPIKINNNECLEIETTPVFTISDLSLFVNL